jgi:DNA-binding IclR family transcriptional regulator
MQMLQYHGFVRQDKESKTYTAGPVLFDMGLQVVRNLDIRSHARPALEELAQRLDETVQLFVLQQGDHLACIDAIESTRPLRVGGRSGVIVPAFATAAGHALLTEMPPERVGQIYPDERLPQIVGAARLRSELEQELAVTRERGYAIQRGEMDPEVSAVAAAIRDGLGRANFAVGIAVPTSRLTDDDAARLGAAVMRSAQDIAGALPW